METPEESGGALLGFHFHLEVAPPGFAEAVARRLPPPEPHGRTVGRPERSYRVERGETDGTFSVFRGPRRPVEAAGLEEAAELVVSDLERHVARQSRGFVLVHAGAVVWKGRAILLPGRSHAGKSSLVAALLAEGAGYLSDEFAVIDPEGRAHPYARPLCLRRSGGLVDRISVQALGASVAGPAPVGLVAFLRYRRGAGVEERSMTPGESLLSLLVHTLEVRRRLDSARTFLRPVATSARAIRGVRGEAEEAARNLLEWAANASTAVAIHRAPGSGSRPAGQPDRATVVPG